MSSTASRSASWKWWITGLLLLATSINYIDRMTLSNASVPIRDELGLTNYQYGNLELAFGWAFALGSLAFGFLADRIGAYLLYPFVLAAWSSVGIATGWTHGYIGLLLCRGMLGFFEAGHWPCALKTTFSLLEQKDRTMGNSVLQSGASIGAIIAPQIINLTKWAMRNQPGYWRYAFIVVGAVGLLWVVLWFAMLRPRDLATKPASVGHDSDTSLVSILTSRRFWAVAILVIGIQLVWHLFRVWLPMFLQIGRGFSQKFSLNFVSVFYIATDIGCILGGALSMWFVRRRKFSAHEAQRGVFVTACLFTSLSIFIPFLGKGWALLIVLLLIGGGALALFPCYYSFTQEVSPRHVGRLTGLLGLWVWATTSPLQPVFGAIVDKTKSYDMGLVVAGLAPWVGVLSLTLLWRRKTQVNDGFPVISAHS